ncbi:class I SAM-dependent methyltransferase [Tepidiforma bonchosmolovskayae]|uniref:Class I SAM-dependent methyltransferase n=1 Tax=Tepidiforma bonchosmolovskayae TaxID=2601677 RepID=A0ABX6C2W1_9CHLR|nr:class I SAM-dependent methyltransferase [Tepidiforma bonchosmolovskayae]QFG03003.1 class I SAM-dependent methyltransferase [Tepidiforma bonchosmolovskayae]
MATDDVLAHYTGEALAERILEAARAAGVHPLTPAALAPADQFHMGGLRATRELARLAGVGPGDRVLDLGCGLGGPARVLAAEFGCEVTGVDLSPEFVRSAAVLTEACGLGERAAFRVADATALPFADASFDVVFTQHVVMNIADRRAFWSEAYRVLRPAGRFAFFDVIRGPNPAEPAYPLPWARDPSISFLLDAAATRALLEEVGFDIEAWNQPAPPAGRPDTTSPFSLRTVMGAGMEERVANIAACMADGRLGLLQGVCRRPA